MTDQERMKMLRDVLEGELRANKLHAERLINKGMLQYADSVISRGGGFAWVQDLLKSDEALKNRYDELFCDK